jgi:hypothetical protein
MNLTKNEKLIISLIKDDLTNAKLLITLKDAGLNADSYQLDLTNTIFQLMGYEGGSYSDKIYDQYLSLSSTVKYINITDRSTCFEPLAAELYRLLLKNCPLRVIR